MSLLRSQPPKRVPLSWVRGTWKSDANKTLAKWVWPRGATGAKLRKILAPSFGLLTVRYTAQRVYSRFNEPEFSHAPYRVLWSNDHCVFIVVEWDDGEEGQLLHFTSRDEYWVHVPVESSTSLGRETPNVRMQRSVWDKVPFEATAAGR